MNLPLLLHFARQDLIDRYAGSVLGGAWSFFLPLTNILIFTLVFSKIMGARLEAFGQEFSQYGYSIYLIAGILPWVSFANTIQRTTTVYRDKAGLIGKVKVGLKTLPLYILVSEAAIFVISMAFFAVFGLAILSVFLRDIREFINVIVQLWFWLTPVVYVITILPEPYRRLISLNPFFTVVNSYRDLIVHHQLPGFYGLAVVFGVSLVVLGLSVALCGKVERELRDFL